MILVRILSGLALLLASAMPVAHAGEALVAVASNFAEPADRLAQAFQDATGHTITISTGSTGRLYTQIVQGAPFDAFLAADTVRPERLENEGLAIAGSRTTYAIGRLAVWDRLPDSTAASPLQRLIDGDYRRLAIANPELAPYVAAAMSVLRDRLEVADASSARQVLGENIGQTFTFVATGNADLGLVALSQLRGRGEALGGRYCVIPAGWHAPIRQQAVLLTRGSGNAAAQAWMTFLASEEAAAILDAFGYDVEADGTP